MSEWQPIESAPIQPFVKEDWFLSGKRILACQKSRFTFIASYGYTSKGKGRWIDHNGRVCTPTHWMPLPEPPK